MPINKALIAELKNESANTKKLMQRVPMEEAEWKPHERSMTLGRLAQHVAELHGWVAMVIQKDELSFDTNTFKAPEPLKSNHELLMLLDNKTSDSIIALEGAADEHLEKDWSLIVNGHTAFTLPRKVVIRTMALNHLIHHRGQLSVYLRLLDIPIPGIYGPSADEK